MYWHGAPDIGANFYPKLRHLIRKQLWPRKKKQSHSAINNKKNFEANSAFALLIFWHKHSVTSPSVCVQVIPSDWLKWINKSEERSFLIKDPGCRGDVTGGFFDQFPVKLCIIDKTQVDSAPRGISGWLFPQCTLGAVAFSGLSSNKHPNERRSVSCVRIQSAWRFARLWKERETDERARRTCSFFPIFHQIRSECLSAASPTSVFAPPFKKKKKKSPNNSQDQRVSVRLASCALRRRCPLGVPGEYNGRDSDNSPGVPSKNTARE